MADGGSVAIEVHIETKWSGAGETVEVVVDLDGLSTEEEIEEACERVARETFHDACNYGWSKKP